VSGFDWDEENIAHIARHGVTVREVEEVFLGNPVIELAYIVDGEERFRAQGITNWGRYLTVAYADRNEKVRPITAWDMTRKDRRIYAPQIHDQNGDEDI